MNIQYKRNCHTCQACRGNQKLRNRIRHAAYDREDGDETLADIANDIGVSVPQMYNHVKKHMTDNTEAKQARREVQVAKKKIEIEARVQKEQELAIEKSDYEAIEARPVEIVGVDEYIAQGMELIRKGQLKVTPNMFLAAVKIKTDWASKQQNTKIEWLKTIHAFRSGGKGEKDVTRRTAKVIDSGEDEARDIYHKTFGNAVAQGSDIIPEEDASGE